MHKLLCLSITSGVQWLEVTLQKAFELSVCWTKALEEQGEPGATAGYNCYTTICGMSASGMLHSHDGCLPRDASCVLETKYFVIVLL